MHPPEQRTAYIDQIERFPAELEALVTPLSEAQLNTRSIDGEWSVRQNVHHVVDSHMNAYIRTKLTLTEDHPTIRPYDQDAWADLPDTANVPITVSLAMLAALHTRWVALFRSTRVDDFARTLHHPDDGDMSLDDLVQSYAAHGQAHIDQIKRALAAQT